MNGMLDSITLRFTNVDKVIKGFGLSHVIFKTKTEFLVPDVKPSLFVPFNTIYYN